MTTFSQMVDDMVLESKRPDLRTEIASYLNKTLRDLHSEPSRGGAVGLRSNMKELRVTAASDTIFTWEMPKVSTFQFMQAVRYDSVVDREGKGQWANELLPGKGMNNYDYFYYQVGTGFAFQGYGGIGSSISLAWYEYVPNLKYYSAATRPATYDEIFGWTYLPAYDTNDATRLIAQQLSSNWILLRWKSFVEEGVRAKIYKRLSDTERARTSYSMFAQDRAQFYSAEGINIPGVL